MKTEIALIGGARAIGSRPSKSDPDLHRLLRQGKVEKIVGDDSDPDANADNHGFVDALAMN
jgi:hypothetical protein